MVVAFAGVGWSADTVQQMSLDESLEIMRTNGLNSPELRLQVDRDKAADTLIAAAEQMGGFGKQVEKLDGMGRRSPEAVARLCAAREDHLFFPGIHLSLAIRSSNLKKQQFISMK